MSKFEIQLRDVRIYARHGVMPEERTLGNQYRINVRLSIDASGFDLTADDISDTVSYADVFEIIKEEMEKPKKLLETVAVCMAKRLSERWNILLGGEIEIVKEVPPISDMIGQAGIKYFF